MQKGVFKIEIYFTDREFNPIGIASTDGAGIIKMSDDHEIVDEDTGVIQFTGVLHYEEDQLVKVKEMSALGNYAVYRRHDGSSACQRIMEFTHNPTDGTREIICEDGALDMLNNVVPAFSSPIPQPFEYYFNIVMADTGIKLGANWFKGVTRTLSYDNEATALERLRTLITDFGGGAFTLDFEFDNMELQTKTLNVIEALGQEKDITLRVGTDVNSITTTGNLYDLTTAIKPFGGTPEGSDTPINLSGYSWVDPDGRFKLQNGVIVDTQEAPKWSRLLSISGGLFTRAVTYDTLDKGKLASLAVAELKKNSVPQFNYEVDIANVPEGLDIGDRIDIVDEKDELYLSGRVLVIDRCTAENTTVVTLGEFIIKYSGLNEQLLKIASDFSKQFDQSVPAEVIVTPSKQFFVNGQGQITLTAKVKKGTTDITSNFTSFVWRRYDASNILDATWTATGKQITITAGTSNVYTYYCSVDY